MTLCVKKNKMIQSIEYQGLMPLFYDDNAETCIAITETLYEAGIRYIEFTNRGKNALPNFKTLIEVRNRTMPDLKLGIGTIWSATDAQNYIDAKADFLISPIFRQDICDIARANKMLWIPGCMTPTEIHTARTAGCEMIKIFPGDVLGATFIKGIKPLFPTLKFVITGGVEPNLENIKSWFDAGAVVVGMGSKLISKNVIQNKDYKQLKINTLNILNIIHILKRPHSS